MSSRLLRVPGRRSLSRTVGGGVALAGLAMALALAAIAAPAWGVRWDKWDDENLEEVESARGVALGSMDYGLADVRDAFEQLGVQTCLVEDVEHRDQYADAVDSYDPDGEEGPKDIVWKTHMYSLTHGGVKRVTRDAQDRHLFYALALVSTYAQTKDRDRLVYPEDLPPDMGYGFAIVAACHSGDQTNGSNAQRLQTAITHEAEDVPIYIACKGGEWGSLITGCDGCAYQMNIKNFAPDFMEQITKLRADEARATIQDAFDRVEDSRRKLFLIKSGGKVRIRDRFPVEG